MDHRGALDTEEELGPLAHLAPSPQSEAVAHEFQELSLQSSQHLPTLNERKNGSIVFGESGLQLPLPAQSVSTGKSEKQSVTAHPSQCLSAASAFVPSGCLSHHIIYSLPHSHCCLVFLIRQHSCQYAPTIAS